MTMIINLLRHAQTQSNLDRKYLGITDEPLTEEGRAYAAQRGANAEVKKVYTSELQRTIQTAQILFPEAEIIPVKDLGEMDFGEFEGRSSEEMKDDPAYAEWVAGDCEGECPGGEDTPTFMQRCVNAFFEVLAEVEEEGAEEATFVVHGGTIMSVMHNLATPEEPPFKWISNHCGGYRVQYEAQEKGSEGRGNQNASSDAEAEHLERTYRPLRVLDTINPRTV